MDPETSMSRENSQRSTRQIADALRAVGIGADMITEGPDEEVEVTRADGTAVLVGEEEPGRDLTGRWWGYHDEATDRGGFGDNLARVAVRVAEMVGALPLGADRNGHKAEVGQPPEAPEGETEIVGTVTHIDYVRHVAHSSMVTYLEITVRLDSGVQVRGPAPAAFRIEVDRGHRVRIAALFERKADGFSMFQDPTKATIL